MFSKYYELYMDNLNSVFKLEKEKHLTKMVVLTCILFKISYWMHIYVDILKKKMKITKKNCVTMNVMS